MAKIAHENHDHPNTSEARKKCRAEMAEAAKAKTWTKTEILHPSGQRLYVSIRDDGKRIRLVAYNAKTSLVEQSSRKAAERPDFPGHERHSITTLEWDSDGWPWDEQLPEEVTGRS